MSRQVFTAPRWEISTPLGVPVDPEVNTWHRQAAVVRARAGEVSDSLHLLPYAADMVRVAERAVEQQMHEEMHACGASH